MILHPCIRCAFRRDCDVKQGMLAKIRGSGLTTATFRCEKRAETIRLGRRVCVTIWNAEQTDSDRWAPREYDGIVIGYRKDKILVWLDRPIASSGHERVYIHHDNLVPLADTVEWCSDCANPKSKTIDWCHHHGAPIGVIS